MAAVTPSTRAAIRCTIAVTYFCTVYYDLFKVKFPEEIQRIHIGFGGRLKFLTFLNMLLQLTYFSFCAVSDLLFLIKGYKCSRLQKAQDHFFAVLAFPVATLVFSMFWSLYLINRELVFPKALDGFFPIWLNHLVHTSIFPAVLLDMIIVHHEFPKRSCGYWGTFGFFLLYLLWTLFLYYVNGVWTYPIFRVLNWWQRPVFFAISILIGTSFYFVGDTLNNIIWGKPKPDPQKQR